MTPRLVVAAVVCLLLATSCRETSVARYEILRVSAANVLVNPDPAALDDAYAELNSVIESGQTIVSADFAACEVTQVNATVRESRVEVTYQVDTDFDCETPNEHRALFLIPSPDDDPEIVVSLVE